MFLSNTEYINFYYRWEGGGGASWDAHGVCLLCLMCLFVCCVVCPCGKLWCLGLAQVSTKSRGSP